MGLPTCSTTASHVRLSVLFSERLHCRSSRFITAAEAEADSGGHSLSSVLPASETLAALGMVFRCSVGALLARPCEALKYNQAGFIRTVRHGFPMKLET